MNSLLTAIKAFVLKSRPAYKDDLGNGKYDVKKLPEECVPNSVRVNIRTAQSTANKAQITANEAQSTANALKENPVFTGSFSQNRKEFTQVGDCSHAEGSDTTASGLYSHAEGKNTTASHDCSHAEGSDTTASGMYSHAEGKNTTASGLYSHAEGVLTTALYECSHSEGRSTTASGIYSHAEGNGTTASGIYSHAEGKNTTASHDCCHAEGSDTTASGWYSHAEGYYTKASGRYSHVQGKYNIDDLNEKYAHIVGNGTSDTARSNAHTLDWEGNAWFAGTVEGTAMIVKSSTQDSTKKFKITVDDTGTISATEVT